MRLGVLAALGAAALALAAPFLLPPLDLRLANLALVTAVAVLGLTFAFGYAGLILIGQAAFAGLGAYGSALLSLRLGWPVAAAIPAGALIAAAAAALVGLPMLRLKGHYLALAAVGLNVSLEIVTRSWDALTGGYDGLSAIPGFAAFGHEASGDRAKYGLLLACLALAALAAWLLRHSPLGRAMVAVRDDEIAAAAAGVDVVATKLAALTLAGLYGGLSGALYAHYANYISPGDFGLPRSIELLAMLVVGGEARIAGAVAGAVFFTFLPEWLRVFGKETYPTVFGLITLASLILMPHGVTGLRLRGRRGAGAA